MSTTKKEYVSVEELPVHCLVAKNPNTDPGALLMSVMVRDPKDQTIRTSGTSESWNSTRQLDSLGYMWSGDGKNWYPFKYTELPTKDPNDAVGKYQAEAQEISGFALRTSSYYDRAQLRFLKKEIALRTSAELVVVGQDGSETVIPEPKEVFDVIHQVFVDGEDARHLAVQFIPERIYPVAVALGALRVPMNYGYQLGYLEGTGSAPHIWSSLADPQFHIRTKNGVVQVKEGEWIVEFAPGDWRTVAEECVRVVEEGGV